MATWIQARDACGRGGTARRLAWDEKRTIRGDVYIKDGGRPLTSYPYINNAGTRYRTVNSETGRVYSPDFKESTLATDWEYTV